MGIPRLRWLIVVLCIQTLLACGGPSRSQPGGAEQTSPKGGSEPREERSLVVAVRSEPASLATRLLQPALVSIALPRRMFNAELAFLDDRGVTHPYLLESLPEFNSDSWQVFPDGRMTTTYRLKDGLTWHDG